LSEEEVSWTKGSGSGRKAYCTIVGNYEVIPCDGIRIVMHRKGPSFPQEVRKWCGGGAAKAALGNLPTLLYFMELWATQN
jgi:hypothetical protein